jgi:hypothetical protein
MSPHGTAVVWQGYLGRASCWHGSRTSVGCPGGAGSPGSTTGPTSPPSIAHKMPFAVVGQFLKVKLFARHTLALPSNGVSRCRTYKYLLQPTSRQRAALDRLDWPVESNLDVADALRAEATRFRQKAPSRLISPLHRVEGVPVLEAREHVGGVRGSNR